MLFFHNQQLIEQYAMAVSSKPKECTFSITVTSQWALWRLKSPAYELFFQPFVLTHIKENIEALRHWPLWGEPPVTGGFPSQRVSNAEMFPFDDVIMENAPDIIMY